MDYLRILKSLLILVFIYGCSYNETKTIEFTDYYDSAHTKPRMKGLIVNGKESGEWIYYDAKGTEVQRGNFNEGCQSGIWKYSYPDVLDSNLNWTLYSAVLFKYTLSMPSTFKVIHDESSIDFSAWDSINGDIFSIKDYDYKNEEDYDTHFKQTSNELLQSFAILSQQSFKISTQDDYYYLNSYNLKHKIESVEIVMYNIYARVGNKIIALSYSCSPSESLRGKFLIGEIYYHLFYKGSRVAIPYNKIKEISQKL